SIRRPPTGAAALAPAARVRGPNHDQEVAMRSSLTGALLISVLSAGLIVAGCGGNGNDNPTTTSSKAEFLKKGNAICRKGNQRINKAGRLIFLTAVKKGQKPTGPPSPAKFKKISLPALLMRWL